MAKTKSNNKKISELLATVRKQVDSAQTELDLIGAVEQIKAFGSPLKFNHLIIHIIGGICGLIAILLGAYQYLAFGKFDVNIMIFMAILAIAVVATLIYVWYKNQLITDLESTLFNKDLQLDNRLTKIQVDAEEYAHQLGIRFNDFNRGNYSREIYALYQGIYQGKEHAFNYHFYHFHYVDKRTTMTTDSKGRPRTRTVYDHYDRYGIYLPFNFISNLALISKSISGVSGYNYKPASIQFNKIYKVIAESEIAAAKFLKPAVVIASEEIANVFSEVNFEFNEDTELCMSFSDDDLLTLTRTCSFKNPDEFIQEIRKVHTLPKLQTALEHIHTLMAYSDNNFRKSNP
ncbi:hypothetical protein [Budvicia diplopodorum]|uniref:hypothetical protein n=1 Tax=Budvicia diplopodorum TaxID=1119056 RepID=UPI0013597948|nr:hypothetical protein [Budvicia diplopodorum]